MIISSRRSTPLILLCLIEEKMLVVPCFPMDCLLLRETLQESRWGSESTEMRIKTWFRLSSGSLTLGCSSSAYLRHGTILKKIPGNNHFYSRFPGSNHSKSRCSIKLKAWLYKNYFTKHTGLCVWLLQVKGLEFNVVSVQDSIDFISTYNTFTSPLRISSISWKLLIMIYGGKNLGNLG